MMALERSLGQRREALARANMIRTMRATVKKQVARGEVPYTTLLDLGRNDPLFATMKVKEALEAMPRIGPPTAARILNWARISPSRTLGSLLDMQWDRLYEAMERIPAAQRRLSEARATVTTP